MFLTQYKVVKAFVLMRYIVVEVFSFLHLLSFLLLPFVCYAWPIVMFELMQHLTPCMHFVAQLSEHFVGGNLI